MRKLMTFLGVLAIHLTAHATQLTKQQITDVGLSEYTCAVTVDSYAAQLSNTSSVFAEDEKDAIKQMLTKINATSHGSANIYVQAPSSKAYVPVLSLTCKKTEN